jgi:hypothetical protein
LNDARNSENNISVIRGKYSYWGLVLRRSCSRITLVASFSGSRAGMHSVAQSNSAHQQQLRLSMDELRKWSGTIDARGTLNA